MKSPRTPVRYIAALKPSSRKLPLKDLCKTALVAINKMPGSSAAKVEEDHGDLVQVSFDWVGHGSPVLPAEYFRNFHLIVIDSSLYASLGE